MTGSMAQMTPLEERLSAALAARAHQVDESDLAPAQVPEPHRRNRGLIILAAAACTALVIGVPYGIAQLDGTEKPQPPATSTSPTPTPTPTPESGDWPIGGTTKVDLDGDGTEDSVRLRIGPAAGLGADSPLQARIEADLPSGTISTVITEGTEYHLEGGADLRAAGGEEKGEELLVSVGTSLRVFNLVAGQLQELKAPSEPPLMRRIDSRGRLVTWVVEGSELSTLRSIEPYEPGAVRYMVDRYRWFIDDGALRTAPYESRCYDTRTSVDTFLSCGAPVTFAPSDLEFLNWNEIGVLDFPVFGARATAEVVLDESIPRDAVSAGDAVLVVKAGGQTWSRPLDEGALPALVTNRIVTTEEEDPVVLVVRDTVPEQVVWELFGWVGGDLVQLRSTETFAPGVIDQSVADDLGVKPQRSWVQDGHVYTALKGPDEGWSVYQWNQEGSTLSPYLVAEDICFTKSGIGEPC